MDKQLLVDQLRTQLSTAARAALASRDAAALEAREGATPDEKREDARAAHQLGTLGKAQQKRAQEALAAADALASFRPAALAGSARIAVGAIVEIEDDERGEGRTFFLAPVGAGHHADRPRRRRSPLGRHAGVADRKSRARQEGRRRRRRHGRGRAPRVADHLRRLGDFRTWPSRTLCRGGTADPSASATCRALTHLARTPQCDRRMATPAAPGTRRIEIAPRTIFLLLGLVAGVWVLGQLTHRADGAHDRARAGRHVRSARRLARAARAPAAAARSSSCSPSPVSR